IINYNILGIFKNKYYFYPVFLAIFYLVHKYYNVSKVEEIISTFNQKSAVEKRLWNFSAVFLLIAPIVTIALLLSK
ncbi:MAG: hypothetical protein ACK5DG_01065, partial [Chitinophagaceae bacterium]